MIKHQTRLSAISWLLTCVLICSPVAGTCAEFHIAPDGQADGDGSKTSPWNLATALARSQAVKPGDILWLHGGTYRGTDDKPIVVRQVPGERATRDAADSPKRGSTVVVHGNHVSYYSQGGSNIVGYGQGVGELTMTGNYLASPHGTAVEIKAEAPTLSGNTFMGRVGGVEPADHTENTYHGLQRSGGVVVN